MLTLQAGGRIGSTGVHMFQWLDQETMHSEVHMFQWLDQETIHSEMHMFQWLDQETMHSEVHMFQWLVWLDQETIHSRDGNQTQVCRTSGGYLPTWLTSNNNNNCIQRHSSRLCTISSLHREPSSTHTFKWPRHNVCKSCATHWALISCNMLCYAPYGTKRQVRDSWSEFKLHLFELYFIGWTIIRWLSNPKGSCCVKRDACWKVWCNTTQNSIPACGHCASFFPLCEHTGVRLSLPAYRFQCFLKFYFTAIVKGVIALNVICLKR